MPQLLVLDSFFEFHIYQPDLQIPLVSTTEFFFFLMYIRHIVYGHLTINNCEAPYYTICLAFRNENNTFISRISTWTPHVHQYGKECENSKVHSRGIEVYFLTCEKCFYVVEYSRVTRRPRYAI